VVLAVLRYDDNDPFGPYVAWYPGDPDDKFQVRPGEAYWVFAATEVDDVPYP